MGRRLAADRLVGTAEVAERLGMKRQHVLHDSRRHYPDFPEPVAHLRQALIWDVARCRTPGEGHGAAREVIRGARGFLVIGAAVLAASCSGGGSNARATTSTRAAMSVQQVASVLAEKQVAVQSALTNPNLCGTMAIDAVSDEAFTNNKSGPPSLKVSTEATMCKSMLTAVTPAADDLASALNATVPPAEVASLARTTSASAANVATTADRFSSCLDAASTEDEIVNCAIRDSDQFGAAVKDLTARLAGWKPYL